MFGTLMKTHHIELLGEEDDDYLLDYSDATEGVASYINKSYTEEETEQHVSPEARRK